MKKLKNGTKVKICSSQREWDKYNNGEIPYYAKESPVAYNEVVKVYQNKETCVVINSHLSQNGWECDLLTGNQKKLCGFALWELKRVLF